jgi:calmodulin
MGNNESNAQMKEEEEDKAKLNEQIELEKAKYGEFDDIFDKFDHDNGGTLDQIEVFHAFRSYCLKHKDHKLQIDDLINQLDLPADYRLSKDEFRNLMICFVGSKDPIDEIIDVFKVFDKNLSAQIGPTELTHVFNKLGLNLTDEESKSLVREGDNDGDDVVDFHEFISIMISK